MFTGFSYRKDFELKDELNWVMAQLHAGGFWDKWNSDQFVREVRETKKDNISPMIENSI